MPATLGTSVIAKYEGRCVNCHKVILPGMPVVKQYAGNKRARGWWVHEDCNNVPSVSADGLPIVAPEAVPAPAALPAPDGDWQQAVIGNLTTIEEKIRELQVSDGALRDRISGTDRTVAQVMNACTGLRDDLNALMALVTEVAANMPKVIEVRRPNGSAVRFDGLTHECFQEVLELVQAGEEVFLPGPAGCGKSHLAGQIATALGRRFGSISCSAGMSESQILGRLVPKGEQGQFEFLGTQFLDCYENGGVFLFDEIDAADPNVLLIVNSALANGHLSVPARHDKPVAKRHPDFVCIAAANTYGKGADRQYVGRNELDESTLDRFRVGCVPMDYSRELEKQLCPDETLRERLWGYRENCHRNRLQRIVSTRFMAKAYKMVSQYGWDYEKVDAKLFAGWREDEIRKAKG
jgi:energy-coupling factor transporter ATP-binding protein EcfA2